MPALVVTVEESRLWKDLDSTKTSNKTVYWKGTSTFAVDGFKVFHMEHFPFDRQLINLEEFHFVWRPDKDEADYYQPMRIVSFTTETGSILAEWCTQPAYVIPIAKFVTIPDDACDPSYASRFIVKLRIEHQHGFYVWQVFFPAYIMTLVSLCPLAMPPSQDDMGDRLGVYTGGLLTLVAFKYGVAEHLPSVPYSTFIDMYLQRQIVTVAASSFESVFSFHYMFGGQDKKVQDEDYFDVSFWNLDQLENHLFLLCIIVWTAYFFYAMYSKPRSKPDWKEVWEQKNQNIRDLGFFEQTDPEGSGFDGSVKQAFVFAGTKIVTTKDNLVVWDINSGAKIGELSVGQVVEAFGPLVSTEVHKRRFDPKDDSLYTKQQFLDKYSDGTPATQQEYERYWNTECKACMMVPIDEPHGAVVSDYMKVQEERRVGGGQKRTQLGCCGRSSE